VIFLNRRGKVDVREKILIGIYYFVSCEILLYIIAE